MQFSSMFRGLVWGTLLVSLAACNPESESESENETPGDGDGYIEPAVSTEHLTCRGGVCTLDSGVALDDEDAYLLVDQLYFGDVVLRAAGNEELVITSEIRWYDQSTLTLQASNDIRLAGGISGYNGKLVIDNPGFDYIVLKPINLPAGPNFRANDKEFIVITQLGLNGSTTGADLQGIEGNSTANYALGADINASPTQNWTPSKFQPLGFYNTFTGTFDGLGHVISNLTSIRSGYHVGLFSKPMNASIRHLILKDPRMSGNNYVGAFAGSPEGSFSIVRSCVIGGSVTANTSYAGGFIGTNGNTTSNTITDSCVLATQVKANASIGGMVGIRTKEFLIDNSYVINLSLQSDMSPAPATIGAFTSSNEGTTLRNSFHNIGSAVGALRNNSAGSTSISGVQATELATFVNQGWDISTDPNGDSLWYLDAGENEPPMLRYLDTNLSGYMPIPD